MSVDGRKDDAGKRPWHLLPWTAIGLISDVMAYGAGRYGAESWRHVPEWRDRYFSALMRHWDEYRQGNLIDPDSGLSHMAHFACNALFLLALSLSERGDK